MKYRPTNRTFVKATSTTTVVLSRAPIPRSVPTPHETTVATISPSHTRLIRLLSREASCAAMGSAHQVQQSEQHDPQQVDHVPEAGAALQEGVLPLAQRLVARQHEQGDQHAHRDQQVER